MLESISLSRGCLGMHKRLEDMFMQQTQNNYFSHKETKSKLISDGSGSFVIISKFTARPTFYINPKEKAVPLV